jgi:hypothetical protein
MKSCAARCLLVRLIDFYLPHYRMDFNDGTAPQVSFYRGLLIWYAFSAPLQDVCQVVREAGEIECVWFCSDVDSRGVEAFLKEM